MGHSRGVLLAATNTCKTPQYNNHLLFPVAIGPQSNKHFELRASPSLSAAMVCVNRHRSQRPPPFAGMWGGPSPPEETPMEAGPHSCQRMSRRCGSRSSLSWQGSPPSNSTTRRRAPSLPMRRPVLPGTSSPQNPPFMMLVRPLCRSSQGRAWCNVCKPADICPPPPPRARMGLRTSTRIIRLIDTTETFDSCWGWICHHEIPPCTAIPPPRGSQLGGVCVPCGCVLLCVCLHACVHALVLFVAKCTGIGFTTATTGLTDCPARLASQKQ
jgi:hypothetical protein